MCVCVYIYTIISIYTYQYTHITQHLVTTWLSAWPPRLMLAGRRILAPPGASREPKANTMNAHLSQGLPRLRPSTQSRATFKQGYAACAHAAHAQVCKCARNGCHAEDASHDPC